MDGTCAQLVQERCTGSPHWHGGGVDLVVARRFKARGMSWFHHGAKVASSSSPATKPG